MEREEKIDRRSLRSQRLLSDALTSLILEKGYEGITNKDITDRADVAYVTLYRHYKDKDDLMNRIIQASLIDLTGQIEQAARGAFSKGQDQQEGQIIFQHVRENANLYRLLLGSNGASRVRRQVQDVVAGIFLEHCPPLQARNPLVPGEVIANHMATALLALVEWWLEHDMPYPVERMARMYHALVLDASIRIFSPD